MTRNTDETRQPLEGEIIGSTVVPDNDVLPLRLAPIVRISAQDDVYYLPEESPDEDPELRCFEQREWLDQELEDGTMFRVHPPIPWRRRHVLLQVYESAPPELFPIEEHEPRLRKICQQSLTDAWRMHQQNDPAQAARWAWHALRAQPDEPFPLEVVIALENGRISTDHLTELRSELAEYPRHTIEASRERWRQEDPQLDELVTFVRGNRSSDHTSRLASHVVGPMASMPPPRDSRPLYLQPYATGSLLQEGNTRPW